MQPVGSVPYCTLHFTTQSSVVGFNWHWSLMAHSDACSSEHVFLHCPWLMSQMQRLSLSHAERSVYWLLHVATHTEDETFHSQIDVAAQLAAAVKPPQLLVHWFAAELNVQTEVPETVTDEHVVDELDRWLHRSKQAPVTLLYPQVAEAVHRANDVSMLHRVVHVCRLASHEHSLSAEHGVCVR